MTMKMASEGDIVRVGDKVVVVEVAAGSESFYEKGEVLEVTSIFSEGIEPAIFDCKNSKGEHHEVYEWEVEKHDEELYDGILKSLQQAIVDHGGHGKITPGKRAPQDNVKHPNHYTQGRFETIEMIAEITKGYSDGFLAHCAGTATKYISRAPFKHETPLEDLKKARQYLDFAIKHLEDGE